MLISVTDDLPYKWMAPESLEKRDFTVQSDVWSFGVVLYEVMTHGGIPYLGIKNEDILEHLIVGNRLPQGAIPSSIYSIAKECWQVAPDDRPNFGTIESKLDALLHDPLMLSNAVGNSSLDNATTQN